MPSNLDQLSAAHIADNIYIGDNLDQASAAHIADIEVRHISLISLLLFHRVPMALPVWKLQQQTRAPYSLGRCVDWSHDITRGRADTH